MTATFVQPIPHKDHCCAVRDESGCCCTGQHFVEDMRYFQRNPPELTDQALRARYLPEGWT